MSKVENAARDLLNRMYDFGSAVDAVDAIAIQHQVETDDLLIEFEKQNYCSIYEMMPEEEEEFAL